MPPTWAEDGTLEFEVDAEEPADVHAVRVRAAVLEYQLAMLGSTPLVYDPHGANPEPQAPEPDQVRLAPPLEPPRPEGQTTAVDDYDFLLRGQTAGPQGLGLVPHSDATSHE